MLIALSLTFTPVASAWAAASGNAEGHRQGMAATGSPVADQAAMNDMPSMDMSDCMKAMQGNVGEVPKGNCKCCDSKQQCPDTANCMTKCCKVIGALKPAGKIMMLTAMVYRQAEPAKPPEWLRTPPAPPPRS